MDAKQISWPARTPLWRRALVVSVALAVLATLIALPELGLRRIHGTDLESHDLDTLLAAANRASSDVHALTPILRQHAESPTPAVSQQATAGIARARGAAYSLAGMLGLAANFGLEEWTARYIRSSLAFAEQAEVRQRLSTEGVPLQQQPNRARFLQAQTEHEADYQRLLNELVRMNGRIESERAAAMTRARQWQAVAIAVAVVAAAGTVAFESRRVGQSFDIERTRAERAERQAEHRGAIVNLASHELRNPLAVMSLSAQMMLEAARGSGDSELELAAADGLAAARRSEAVVAELLDLARLDADRLELTSEPVALAPMLTHAIELATSHRGPRPVVVAGTPLRDVLADRSRLAIIIRNMVDNAFKYSPDGTAVEITVRDEDGDVTVDVTDSGPGVPLEDRERVFNRYERLSATQHIGGVGIGLHLSRELARRMGGELAFRDADRGARLRLVLPEPEPSDHVEVVRRSA